jgi:hypothetical protein
MAVNGDGMPMMIAATMENPWAKLVGNANKITFRRLSYTPRPRRTASAMVANKSSARIIFAACMRDMHGWSSVLLVVLLVLLCKSQLSTRGCDVLVLLRPCP